MKTIGDVGITYLDTAPENCLLLPATITAASHPELFAVANAQRLRGNTLFVLSGNSIQIKDPQFPVNRIAGDTQFGTLGQQSGARTHTLTVAQMPVHTHVQHAHSHVNNGHNHTQDPHTHGQDPHTHGQDPHTHGQDPHTHAQYGHHHTVPSGHVSHQTGALIHTISERTEPRGVTAVTATNNPTTATNVPNHGINHWAEALNQWTEATNHWMTVHNHNITATNQNTGSGHAFSILPPYTVVNYWICYQE